ncbi:hypothetical protein M432DRAFT_64988 [Thermoascus aurantiacus ATCC 26904]
MVLPRTQEALIAQYPYPATRWISNSCPASVEPHRQPARVRRGGSVSRITASRKLVPCSAFHVFELFAELVACRLCCASGLRMSYRVPVQPWLPDIYLDPTWQCASCTVGPHRSIDGEKYGVLYSVTGADLPRRGDIFRTQLVNGRSDNRPADEPLGQLKTGGCLWQRSEPLIHDGRGRACQSSRSLGPHSPAIEFNPGPEMFSLRILHETGRFRKTYDPRE